jgi:hypothetical protein
MSLKGRSRPVIKWARKSSEKRSETLPQFPRRLPHSSDMSKIARQANKEIAVSS